MKSGKSVKCEKPSRKCYRNIEAWKKWENLLSKSENMWSSINSHTYRRKIVSKWRAVTFTRKVLIFLFSNKCQINFYKFCSRINPLYLFLEISKMFKWIFECFKSIWFCSGGKFVEYAARWQKGSRFMLQSGLYQTFLTYNIKTMTTMTVCNNIKMMTTMTVCNIKS